MVDFKDILPNLQSLTDAAIANMTFQFTGYSLDQCEIFMQIVIQQLITIIYENKNSPEKMEEITKLEALTDMLGFHHKIKVKTNNYWGRNEKTF